MKKREPISYHVLQIYVPSFMCQTMVFHNQWLLSGTTIKSIASGFLGLSNSIFFAVFLIIWLETWQAIRIDGIDNWLGICLWRYLLVLTVCFFALLKQMQSMHLNCLIILVQWMRNMLSFWFWSRDYAFWGGIVPPSSPSNIFLSHRYLIVIGKSNVHCWWVSTFPLFHWG